MKITALILSTALVVPATLAAQIATPGNNPTQSGQSSSELSNKDKLFLHTLASEDQFEIELAHLALKKSNDPQVQQYARTKILGADPSMEQGAKQLAQQEHATISAEPTPMDKKEYGILSNLSGKQFDQSYIGYESRKQAADLNVVQGEIGATSNQQVKDYAQKEEKPVQQASQAAQQLAHSMGIDSR